MNQIEKDIDALYDNCGISKDMQYHVNAELNIGQLNNNLYIDRTALSKNSAFSYSACGASSVGLDWLNKNGYSF